MAGFWNGVKRFFGQTGKVLKKVGEVGFNFVRDNHAPLAMLAQGIGNASGNPALKKVGDLAMGASGLAGMGQQMFSNYKTYGDASLHRHLYTPQS